MALASVTITPGAGKNIATQEQTINSVVYEFQINNIADSTGLNYMAVDSLGQITAKPPMSGAADAQAAAANQSIALLGYNGTTFDRVRVDGNTTGVLRVTTGGSNNLTTASTSRLQNADGFGASGSATNAKLLSAATRRLCKVINTANVAQANPISFYDSSTAAGAAAGNLLMNVTLGAGQILTLDLPLTNGLVVQANTAAVPASQDVIFVYYA